MVVYTVGHGVEFHFIPCPILFYLKVYIYITIVNIKDLEPYSIRHAYLWYLFQHLHRGNREHFLNLYNKGLTVI